MDTIKRTLRRLWPWLRWCLLVLALLFAALVGLSVYVLFFAQPDAPFEPSPWPLEQARIQASEPVFEWPLTDDMEYQFEIHQGERSVLSRRILKPRIQLPYGTLKPGESYRWEVFPVNERGEVGDDPVVRRHFKVAQEGSYETFWRPVTVFPKRLSITPDRMMRRLSLEVSHDGPWRISLPAPLVFVDGEKHLNGTGISVVNFYFDQARAPADAGLWKPIEIWAGGRTIEVPLIPGTRPNEAWYEGVDPAFSPYLDTPSFANFERSLLSRLTQGTCVGIALVVKLFFERVSFGDHGGKGIQGDFLTATRLFNSVLTASRISVRSSTSFRDLTDKQPALVMSLMSSLHVENLNPQHLRETLSALFVDDDQGRVERTLWEQLKAGKLPVVAGFRVRPKVFKLSDSLARFSVLDAGHAFIVYRGWRYGDATVFAVYDPNFEYREERPRLTTLVFYRDGRTAYFVGETAQRDLVRFVPMETGRLFTFFALAGHGTRENLSETGEALGDLLRSLSLE